MKEIRKAIKEMAQNDDEIYSTICQVIAVDEGKRTCDVEPLDGGAAVYDVRLQANEKDLDGLVYIPKVGSNVIVSFISKSSGFVSMFSQLESVSIVKDDVNIANETKEIFSIMSDLIDVLKEFKLSTNVGVTIGVLPDIILKLENLKSRNSKVNNKFKKLLK